MKGKLKFIVVPFLVLCCFACTFFAACKEALDTPTGVSMNLDNYTLSWSRVDNARSYEVSIESADGSYSEIQTVSRTKYSLSLTSLPENSYDVKVRAMAGETSSYGNSAWSETISFDKDYYSGCTFSLVNNASEYEITGWSNATGVSPAEIIIPAVYRGKPVVGIADSAFKGKSALGSVTVDVDEDGEGNLRYIGSNAFYNCTKLTSITLPDSVTEIGSGAFYSCRTLESFRVPAGVKTIESNTFLYCYALTDLDLGSVETISEAAFKNCNKSLEHVTFPDTVKEIGEEAFYACSVLFDVEFGSGLETIGVSAFGKDPLLTDLDFSGCSSLVEIGEMTFANCTGITSVTLPDGLETIGANAFYGDNQLGPVEIPSSVTEVGAYAFHDTAYYNEQVDAGNNFIYEDNWVIDFINPRVYDETTGLSPYEVTSISVDSFSEDTVGIANQAFMNSAGINTIAFSTSIKYIGAYAFYYSTSVWQVRMSDGGVKEIGSYAFSRMTTLSSLAFGTGLEKIGDHAFYYCSSLKDTFSLPASLTSIGGYAFRRTGVDYDSSGVMYVGTADGGANIWAVGFDESTLSGAVALDADIKGVGEYAFSGATSLTSVSGLNYVTYVGEGAFYKCSALTNCTLSRYMTEICDYTFYGCSSLVAIGDSYAMYSNLERIGRSAFYGCSSFTTFNLSYSPLKYIGKYAFFNSGISAVDLMDTLEEIDDFAFYKTPLTEISLPNSLQRIGQKAFYKCTDLVDVDFGSGDVELEIDDYAFYKCESITSLDIPGRVRTIGDYAFYKCTSVETLTLGEGVEEIGSAAFASLSISKIHIPSSVRYIGNLAFKSCSNVTSVVIPKTVQVIGEHAFYGLTNATFYTDAESILGQWNAAFNTSYRPIVWGCTLSGDDSYVVSVTVGEDTVDNVVVVYNSAGELVSERLCTAPERDGYVFAGWSTTAGGDVEYSASELSDVPVGTTVYAVWIPA